METNDKRTPIQKQIEMAVTNGRGYLEKDETRYSSSLFRMRMDGYQKPQPLGAFSLIIDGLEGKLAGTPFKKVYDDMIESSGEWQNFAYDGKRWVGVIPEKK